MLTQAIRLAVIDDVADAPPTRARSLPICPICRDTVVAAEASALRVDGYVQHLWSCETCGYGFVTEGKLPICH